MLSYSSQVSWILIVAFALSLLYELYRSTAKAGTSKHDSMGSFLTLELPFTPSHWSWLCWCGRDGHGQLGRSWPSAWH
jgi:hypothetical protein